jgi:hypothetical protein
MLKNRRGKQENGWEESERLWLWVFALDSCEGVYSVLFWLQQW